MAVITARKKTPQLGKCSKPPLADEFPGGPKKPIWRDYAAEKREAEYSCHFWR
jgi:hypothetical protein